MKLLKRLTLLTLGITLSTSVFAIDTLRVEKNKIVNEKGEVVVLRGVALIDPVALMGENEWNENHFEQMAKWKVELARIPVTPINWQKKGKEFYIKAIEQAVKWAKPRGIYLIIDWHSIGNLKDNKYQLPIYNTTLDETLDFWKTIAKHFNGEPTIAFYEIFNEPTTFFGKLGKMTWEEWCQIVEKIVNEIREYDKTTIPLVAGLRWAYDLSKAKERPFNLKGIAYSVHPYPQKEKDDKNGTKEEKWEKTWGFIADKYPMVATEFGFMAKDDPGSHIPCIDDETYGKRIINYFSKKGISWTVWSFHWAWHPALLNRDYTPKKGEGEFFHNVISNKIKCFDKPKTK